LYNVTLRRIYITIVAMEKHQVLHILSVRLYSHPSRPTCKLYLLCTVLYCHMWPVWLYFPQYPITTIFRKKKLLNVKCVFCFSLQLLSETFLILRRIQQDNITTVCRSSCKVPIICVRF